MLRHDADLIGDPAEMADDGAEDEGTADGMVDDDDVFELGAGASPAGGPRNSGGAVVEELSRVPHRRESRNRDFPGNS